MYWVGEMVIAFLKFLPLPQVDAPLCALVEGHLSPFLTFFPVPQVYVLLCALVEGRLSSPEVSSLSPSVCPVLKVDTAHIDHVFTPYKCQRVCPFHAYDS